ncbi:hypothetical protein HK405_006530 [Cladochytrium tenue]|nr:hypothetical protein HK405_006530 [Cladochytrium tenue]
MAARTHSTSTAPAWLSAARRVLRVSVDTGALRAAAVRELRARLRAAGLLHPGCLAAMPLAERDSLLAGVVEAVRAAAADAAEGGADYNSAISGAGSDTPRGNDATGLAPLRQTAREVERIVLERLAVAVASSTAGAAESSAITRVQVAMSEAERGIVAILRQWPNSQMAMKGFLNVPLPRSLRAAAWSSALKDANLVSDAKHFSKATPLFALSLPATSAPSPRPFKSLIPTEAETDRSSAHRIRWLQLALLVPVVKAFELDSRYEPHSTAKHRGAAWVNVDGSELPGGVMSPIATAAEGDVAALKKQSVMRAPGPGDYKETANVVEATARLWAHLGPHWRMGEEDPWDILAEVLESLLRDSDSELYFSLCFKVIAKAAGWWVIYLKHLKATATERAMQLRARKELDELRRQQREAARLAKQRDDSNQLASRIPATIQEEPPLGYWGEDNGDDGGSDSGDVNADAESMVDLSGLGLVKAEERPVARLCPVSVFLRHGTTEVLLGPEIDQTTLASESWARAEWFRDAERRAWARTFGRRAPFSHEAAARLVAGVSDWDSTGSGGDAGGTPANAAVGGDVEGARRESGSGAAPAESGEARRRRRQAEKLRTKYLSALDELLAPAVGNGAR